MVPQVAKSPQVALIDSILSEPGKHTSFEVRSGMMTVLRKISSSQQKDGFSTDSQRAGKILKILRSNPSFLLEDQAELRELLSRPGSRGRGRLYQIVSTLCFARWDRHLDPVIVELYQDRQFRKSTLKFLHYHGDHLASKREEMISLLESHFEGIALRGRRLRTPLYNAFGSLGSLPGKSSDLAMRDLKLRPRSPAGKAARFAALAVGELRGDEVQERVEKNKEYSPAELLGFILSSRSSHEAAIAVSKTVEGILNGQNMEQISQVLSAISRLRDRSRFLTPLTLYMLRSPVVEKVPNSPFRIEGPPRSWELRERVRRILAHSQEGALLESGPVQTESIQTKHGKPSELGGSFHDEEKDLFSLLVMPPTGGRRELHDP